LNRNFAAFWGGAGTSRLATDEIYAGPGPASEPETRAWRNLLRGLQPTVVVAHHSMMEKGAWLHQPGFRDPAIWTPAAIAAEAGAKRLGDAMSKATGWPNDPAFVLGDTTGASDDWSYATQGALVLTGEARGRGFHDDFARMVIAEYVGVPPRGGMQEALLRSVEIGADPAHHAVLQGTAPPGAMLRLERRVGLSVCAGGVELDACRNPTAGPVETLQSQLRVPASGRYRWRINPTDLPFVGEVAWTMTCTGVAGRGPATEVRAPRGQAVTVDLDAVACGGAAPNRPARLAIRTTLRGEAGTAAWVLRAVVDGPGSAPAANAIGWDTDGDGEVDRVGRSLVWAPSASGTRVVTVRAKTTAGPVTASMTLVTPAPPAARVVASSTRLRAGEAVALWVPRDRYGEAPRVSWDLDGDDAFDDGVGSLVARRIAEPGTYRVRARVVDAAGRVSTPRITLLVRP
jgi:hypothetical protein